MNYPQTYTEAELVRLLKQRNREAFFYLYDHYAPALNGVILNILPDAGVAGDVLQEVFVKIWRQMESYDPAKGRLFTWMHRIARNTAIDAVRGKDWKKSRLNDPLTENNAKIPDSGVVPAHDSDLRKMVAALKEEHKILVELSYFQGYTQDEIAKMLHIPLGTVKTRIRAALTRLRRLID